MPLYECEDCHCYDNTALTNYWQARMQGTSYLCSQCDPAIGKWHGRFKRGSAADMKQEEPNWFEPDRDIKAIEDARKNREIKNANNEMRLKRAEEKRERKAAHRLQGRNWK